MNQRWFDVRTDLALEERERFSGDDVEIAGVELREWEEKQSGVKLTEVIVKDEHGARVMRKSIGRYLTLEAQQLAVKDEDFHREVSVELGKRIRALLRENDVENTPVLVVGLGNVSATPDALGPKVLEHLQVTRHLSVEYGDAFCRKHGYPILSGITPGVMAQTGMETAEIVRGVVQETKPGVVIVVDALAARSVKRLCVTIQISDTGIQPGAGVGNHRHGLTEEFLGVPVLAIGVPTVVGAAAIVNETVGMLETEVKEERDYGLISELMGPQMESLYVTPHNIDERVDILSFTISEAIHEALFSEPSA